MFPTHQTLRDCERALLKQHPGHAQAQDGEIWICVCGRHFRHFCDEAEGCCWDLVTQATAPQEGAHR